MEVIHLGHCDEETLAQYQEMVHSDPGVLRAMGVRLNATPTNPVFTGYLQEMAQSDPGVFEAMGRRLTPKKGRLTLE